MGVGFPFKVALSAFWVCDIFKLLNSGYFSRWNVICWHFCTTLPHLGEKSLAYLFLWKNLRCTRPDTVHSKFIKRDIQTAKIIIFWRRRRRRRRKRRSHFVITNHVWSFAPISFTLILNISTISSTQSQHRKIQRASLNYMWVCVCVCTLHVCTQNVQANDKLTDQSLSTA